jgi:DNA excision repair protein ERCC-5
MPLFIPDSDSDADEQNVYDEQDELVMAAAIQASLEDKEAEDMQRAVEASVAPKTPPSKYTPLGSSSQARKSVPLQSHDDEDIHVHTPSRLETALSFANTRRDSDTRPYIPSLVSKASPKQTRTPERPAAGLADLYIRKPDSLASVDDILLQSEESDSDMEEMEEIIPQTFSSDGNVASPPQYNLEGSIERAGLSKQDVPDSETRPTQSEIRSTSPSRVTVAGTKGVPETSALTEELHKSRESTKLENTPAGQLPASASALALSASIEGENLYAFDSDDEERWSRSPSPFGVSGAELRRVAVEESWDAAQEMDVSQEEGEFARFVSQVKGKDIGTVQKELDEEIRTLNLQRKAAMRDSEDVTQVMVTQIMVGLSEVNC